VTIGDGGGLILDIGYWPIKSPPIDDIEAFDQLFEMFGYQESDDSYDPEFDKIALFVSKDGPEHAARQIDSNWWTSKLGKNVDIAHKLRELEGPSYGALHKIFEKRISR
jgi:hypothetical protein